MFEPRPWSFSGADRGCFVEMSAREPNEECFSFVRRLGDAYLAAGQQANLDGCIESRAATEHGLKFSRLVFNKGWSYDLFKGEAGLHRLSRVSEIFRDGKVYTSSVFVEVFPFLHEVDFDQLSGVRITFFGTERDYFQSCLRHNCGVAILNDDPRVVAGSFGGLTQFHDKVKASQFLAGKLARSTDDKVLESYSVSAGLSDRTLGFGDSRALRVYRENPVQYISDLVTGEKMGRVADFFEGNIFPFAKAFEAKVREVVEAGMKGREVALEDQR